MSFELGAAGSHLPQASKGPEAPLPPDLPGLARHAFLQLIPQASDQLALGRTTETEAAFLDRWRKILAPDKWGQFLLGWARALAAYETPLHSIDSTTYHQGHITIGGQQFTTRYSLGGNYQQREALMKSQKPYKPQQHPESFGLNLTEDCLLCQNIMQAVDAAQNPGLVANNVLMDLGDYLLLPNRYPSHPGASLFLPKSHDDERSRIPSDCQSQRVAAQLRKQGLTTGRIQHPKELLRLIQVCDALDLYALRNHVLDGMSIPRHDHWQVCPKDISNFAAVDSFIEHSRQSYPGMNFFPQAGSPFDTRILTAEEPWPLAAAAASLIEALERNGEVFTLGYYQNHFFFSPRFSARAGHSKLKIGCSTQLLNIDPSDSTLLQAIENYVPLRGQFDWSRYAPPVLCQ